MIEAQESITGTISGPIAINSVVNNGVVIPEETDPTVPSHVKAITEEDIARWNGNAGEKYVSDAKLVGTNLILYFNDGTTIKVDLSSLGGGGLTTKQIEALENMTASIIDGELVLNYDDTLLDFEFSIVDKELVVDNNEAYVDFNINENEEMEVIY